MKHVDQLVERVLTLDGLPNLQDLGKLRIGENVTEMFDADIASEQNNQGCLKDAISVCEDKSDYISREILKNILDDTEEHIDWIETQQTRIELAGLQNYIQQHMHEGDNF